MDDVAVMLRRVVELREAGSLTGASADDLLRELLGRVESRAQLEDLLSGLPDAELVIERVEEFLLFADPVVRSDRELVELAQRHLREMVGHAMGLDSPVLVEALELLCEGPIVVSLERGRRQGVRLTVGTYGPAVGDVPAGSLLTTEHLRAVEDYDSEKLFAAVMVPFDDPWMEVAEAFYSVTEGDDAPGVGAWLMAPALRWDLSLDAFYRVWEAGAVIWVTPTGVEIERNGRYKRATSYRVGVAEPTSSPVDAQWLSEHADGERVAELVARAMDRGGLRLELEGLAMTSLPPSFFQSTSWRVVLIRRCSGPFDISGIVDLPELESLALSECGLTEVPANWPVTLQRLTLDKNQLTEWPAGLGAAGLERLDLRHNLLTQVPDEVAAMRGLDSLDLKGNRLQSVSSAVGKLSNLKQLFLSQNPQLTVLPAEILDLPGDCYISLHKTGLNEAMQRATSIDELRQLWT